MLKLSLIVFISSAFSGIFEETGMLRSIEKRLGQLENPRQIFGAVILLSLLTSSFGCTQVIAVILTYQLVKNVYDKKGISKDMLALDLENTAIVIAALIPWNLAGLVPAATLSIGFGYVPFAFFLYLIPIWNYFMNAKGVGGKTNIQFDPNNTIIKLCLQGMGMEENGENEEASLLFLKAWSESTDDFERFFAAYFVSRHQKNSTDKLKWLETALQLALKINNEVVGSALSSLYFNMAECYEELHDFEQERKYRELSNANKLKPSDKGPFYHGTKADLEVGDLLTAGGDSNYKPELKMNHIYFTALVNGAGLAAALAKGEGRERVYIVEPMGHFENDPNVTDKKFPGNPTRSYRSQEPLKIVGEATDWARQTPEQLHLWRERLANTKGEIIN